MLFAVLLLDPLLTLPLFCGRIVPADAIEIVVLFCSDLGDPDLSLKYRRYKFLECSSFTSCSFRCHGVAADVLVVFLLVGNVIF